MPRYIYISKHYCCRGQPLHVSKQLSRGTARVAAWLGCPSADSRVMAWCVLIFAGSTHSSVLTHDTANNAGSPTTAPTHALVCRSAEPKSLSAARTADSPGPATHMSESRCDAHTTQKRGDRVRPCDRAARRVWGGWEVVADRPRAFNQHSRDKLGVPFRDCLCNPDTACCKMCAPQAHHQHNVCLSSKS
jgi:hypothetical protein